MARIFIMIFKNRGYALAALLILFSLLTNAQGWLNLSSGANQYVNVGDLDVAGSQITVEALVTQTASGVDVVSKHTNPSNSNYLLRMGSFEFTTSNGFYSLPSSFTYNNNEIYHIAAVYDGSQARYYVNGCLVNSIPASGTLFQNNLTTCIGNQSSCACEQFVGYIDEVRIWNVARIQVDLAANMNSPLPTPTAQTGLLGYYQFEGNLVNVQGNATFNGTAVGGASSGFNPNISIPWVDPIAVSANTADLSCNGDNSGSITATGSGGVGSYEYSIDGTNYQASGSFPGLAAGAYTVYVSWNNSCSATSNVTITEPQALAVNVTDTTDVSCNGDNDGQIAVTGQGGTPTYAYNWSNGANTGSNTGLTANTYTVTITDQNSCTISQSYTITQPGPLSVNILNITDVTCYNGSNGSAEVEGLGGSGSYTYQWPGGQTNALATNLTAGTYTVTVTDAAGCTATRNIPLTQPAVFTADIGIVHHVSCNGGSDGEAIANGSGGAPNYIYSWSNGELGNTATGLSAGTSTVTLTDANGCTVTATTTITEPTPVDVSITDSTDVLCYGGSTGTATASGSGGTPNYTYLWDGGQNSWTANNLNAGIHNVTVTDANNCTASATVIIGEPDTLLASPTGIINVSCNGGSDGVASVNATGGVPSYGYSWSNNQATQTISGLTSGAYTVTVTDANGCTAVTTAMVNQPAVLTVNMTNISDISCYGYTDGEATASVTGGVFPYTYVWSNGGTANIEGALTAGTSMVTVTDNKGCTATATVSISEPTQVTVNASGDVVLCLSMNSALSAQAGGGTGPYTFHWNNGFVGQPVTVSPNHTVDYWVFAKDVNGCNSAADSVTVYVLPVLSATTSPSVAICEGDTASISVTAAGGNSNYSYAWSNGNTGTGPYTVQPDTTTVYTVTVSDNCNSPQVVKEITITVNPLPDVDFVGDSLEGCVPHTVNFENNTTIESGGISTWLWEFGDGESTDFIAPAYIYDTDTTYTVKLTATSNKGCVDSLVRMDYITAHPVPKAGFEPDESIVSIIYANVRFDDKSSGATTWYWSFDDSTYSSLQSPTHLFPDTGTYFVKQHVENVHGCYDEYTDRIIVTPLFTVYVPNTFTPDEDNLNDVFKPVGVGFDDYQMDIYDRWGNLVYKDEGIDIAWDGYRRTGIEAEQGVYVYYIFFRDLTGKQRRYRGMVTLIR